MSKYDLSLSSPLMNAAGSLGFSPDAYGPVDLDRFGAFVTNPISLEPRTPARGVRCLPYPGGFLLHTGYPNPGFHSAVRSFQSRWARSTLPVIVHLLGDTPHKLAQMVRGLENLEGVMGVELGLPPDVPPATAAAMVEASLGELPLVVRLPVDRAGELAESLHTSGAWAISLGPPRGALTGPDGQLVQGRLYGPALFPLALAAIRRVTQSGFPVIGAGGVYKPENIQAMMDAGAIAVQLDSVLWRGF